MPTKRKFVQPTEISFDNDPIVSTNGMMLRFIPGGHFDMGCYADENSAGNTWERPVHRVYPSCFWMNQHQVTQQQFEDIMGYNPSRFKGKQRPVEMITWHEAIEYCSKLNKISTKNGLITDQFEFSLPTVMTLFL